MELFSISVPKRFFLGFVLVIFALSLSLPGCSSKPAEEQVKVTKRMKIVYPKPVPVKKKVVKKKKKVVKTAKPEVKWVSPKKATIKRKSRPKAVAAPKKTTAVAKKAPAPVKKSSVGTTAKASSGTNYVVSLSSFKERDKAATLAAKLRGDGYNAYVTETISKGVKWYRVRCGFFEGYTEASEVKEKLAKRYFAKGAWVDKPTKAEVAEFAK